MGLWFVYFENSALIVWSGCLFPDGHVFTQLWRSKSRKQWLVDATTRPSLLDLSLDAFLNPLPLIGLQRDSTIGWIHSPKFWKSVFCSRRKEVGQRLRLNLFKNKGEGKHFPVNTFQVYFFNAVKLLLSNLARLRCSWLFVLIELNTAAVLLLAYFY